MSVGNVLDGRRRRRRRPPAVAPLLPPHVLQISSLFVSTLSGFLTFAKRQKKNAGVKTFRCVLPHPDACLVCSPLTGPRRCPVASTTSGLIWPDVAK